MKITKRTELPKLMKHLGLPMRAIELGCAEGYSAKDFLEAGVEVLYMVDAWATIPGQIGDGGFNTEWHEKNYKDAMERIEPYRAQVFVQRGLTHEMAFYIPDNRFGLVYIDADHSYIGVKHDIHNYWNKLVVGAIMAFHDYENEVYGVKQAVNEFAEQNHLTVHLLPETKKDDAGAYLIKL